MKLRLTHEGDGEFEAEITTERPVSIPGPIALKRKDTGDFLALRDCFGLPVKAFKKYDILMASVEERTQLIEAGYYDYIEKMYE